MKTIVRALVPTLLALVLALAILPHPAAIAQPAELPLPNGYFYTQTSPEHGLGYRITNEAGVPFWDAFQGFGGVNALGYPISRRFVLDGFTSQATQRGILQWDPAARRTMLVNILDRLHDAGLDADLVACCSTPPPLAPGFDAGKDWERIVADRLALLEARPALRATYFAAPNFIERYGLPTSAVTDMGNHWAIRTQRTVLQEWKTGVPWAVAGQVTIANSGDLARLGSLIPLEALAPEPVNPADEDQPGLTSDQSAALERAAGAVSPATVKVIAAPSSSGSGFIASADGLVITANHVVEDATRIGVILPDGRRFAAELVGRDAFFDVAVLRISGENLPVAQLGSSATVSRGDPVVALGYGALTPQDLDVNPGRVVALGSSRRPGESARTTFLVTDVGLIPGFSGGPLVDAEGRVVGLNTAVITASRSSLLVGQSLAVASDAIAPVVRLIVEGSGLTRVSLGVTSADLTEEVSTAFALAVPRGALIVRVAPDSAAERASLKPGDIITRANGRPVYGADDLASALETEGKADVVILLEIVGNDGIWRIASVEAGSR